MTSLFLSYARHDDEPFARRLHHGLTDRGFDVWFDRLSMPSRQLTFTQEIRDAIAARERLVLVVGPEAARSDYVNQEWRNALEMGKCVNPIVRLDGEGDDGATIDGYELVPEELKLLHAEDFRDDESYDEHLENLARQLAEPAPPLGKLVAVPTLPPHYRAEPDRLRALRDALLIDLRRPVVVTGAAARVGVQGMPGIGKSVLAMALARDPDVRRAFPDGIYWLGIGQNPTVVEHQRWLAGELGGEADFDNVRRGKERLRDLLAMRKALLILDDVWSREPADAFDVLGPMCKLVLTTRHAGLVSALAGTGYQVQLPSIDEALALLAKATDVATPALPVQAREVVEECGRLPLALALCGGLAKAGTPWRDLLGALREHELEFISEEHAAEPQHGNLWRAMELSVRVLPEDTQRRFSELAVFAVGRRVPEGAVLTLWRHTGGLSERAARRLLVDLKQRSLVLLDKVAGAVDSPLLIGMHDLLHDFATRLADRRVGSLAELHRELLDAYREICPEGWARGPDDGYFYRHLREHLIGAERLDELVGLLTDLRWLEAKAGHGLLFDLPLEFDDALGRLRPDHSRRNILRLVNAGIRRDIYFIARHPGTLFQCLWNSGWWYDCPEAARHYISPNGPWSEAGEKLSALLEAWRAEKERASPGFPWVRALRPPAIALDSAQLAVLRGHEHGVTSVVVAPDGRRVVSGSSDKTLRVWDIDSGAELGVLRGHDGVVTSVAVAPDGCWIVSGSNDGTIRVWDIDSGAELAVLRGHNEEVSTVAVTRDGRRVLGGGRDRTVRLWDIDSWAELAVLRGHEDKVSSVAVTSDGCWAVSGSRDGTLRVWDLDSGAEIGVLRGHEDKVRSVAVAPDSRRAVSGSRDGTLRVWDIESAAELAVLRGHENGVLSVGVSSDGRRTVTGSEDRTVRVWDIDNRMEMAVLRGHEEGVSCVAVAPDGRRAVSGSRDGTLRVWNIESGAELAPLRGHDAQVLTLAVAHDGRHLVTGSCDATVRVWDIESGAELAVLRGHENWVWCVGLVPDCRRVVSGSWDGTVRVWEIESGAELAVLRGHEREVSSVAVVPDGCRLVSGSWDGTVRVWDIESGDELAALRGHEGEVSSLVVLPDGRRVTSKSSDGSVRLWDIDTAQCLQVTHGRSDVHASAVGPDQYPFRVVSRNQQTVVEEAETGKAIAWYAAVLKHISTCPSGRTWVGALGSHVQIITLEGNS